MPVYEQLDIAVILLNWNGEDDSLACIDALRKQTYTHTVIAVDNGSSDGFVKELESNHPEVILLKNSKNLGFSGGVNTGIRYAVDNNFRYVALINNDALPDATWLKVLANEAEKNSQAGIVTGKLLKTDGSIDSTGDQYTSWGLAYPRGRDEKDKGQYDNPELVFAASGGASLYRIEMLREIGMFDEDFFAYYEDVDLSFRAQLSGWKVLYNPNAVAHHKVGATSGRIKGFTTYHTIKNLPWLYWKNVPWSIIFKTFPKFFIAYASIVTSSLVKGKFIPVLKGLFITTLLFPIKLIARHRIQKTRKVSDLEISMMITDDLPPNAHKLRKLRSVFRRLSFRSNP